MKINCDFGTNALVTRTVRQYETWRMLIVSFYEGVRLLITKIKLTKTHSIIPTVFPQGCTTSNIPAFQNSKHHLGQQFPNCATQALTREGAR